MNNNDIEGNILSVSELASGTMVVSKPVKWIVGVPYFLWALLFTISYLFNLKIAVSMLSVKELIIAVVVFFIIGWAIALIPLYLTWGGFSKGIEWAETRKTKTKGYFIFIGTLVGAVVASWVSAYLVGLLIAFVFF